LSFLSPLGPPVLVAAVARQNAVALLANKQAARQQDKHSTFLVA
jgi:hypothetical protein